MATILDGKQTAKDLRADIAIRVAAWKEQSGVTPVLAAVLVGDDPASQVYVRNKEKGCEKVGIESRLIRLPADTTQEQLMDTVNQLNDDKSVNGILVQLPLPKGLDDRPILDAIDPMKDVDAFHPENVGLLSQGRPRFLPCTPHGVLQVLKAYDISTSGKHVVVIGRSDIVGKPMGMLLVQKDGPVGKERANATVSLCHSRTADLKAMVSQADIVVAAVGVPEMVKGDMLKPGAVVIDVGINRVEKGLVGDVDFASASEVASAITPVPGGIGPLTVTMLLENTFEACKIQNSKTEVTA